MSAAFEAIRAAGSWPGRQGRRQPRQRRLRAGGQGQRRSRRRRARRASVGRRAGRSRSANRSRRAISRANAREVLDDHLATGRTVASIVAERGFRQISDADTLGPIVDRVIAENPKAVADYRAGKPTAGFLVGQVDEGDPRPGQRRRSSAPRSATGSTRPEADGAARLMGAVSAVLSSAARSSIVDRPRSRARSVDALPGAQGAGRQHRPLRGVARRGPRRRQDRRLGRDGDPPAAGPAWRAARRLRGGARRRRPALR